MYCEIGKKSDHKNMKEEEEKLMIKLRGMTVVPCGMNFIGNTVLEQRNNSIIHHDPSAFFDLKLVKA